MNYNLGSIQISKDYRFKHSFYATIYEITQNNHLAHWYGFLLVIFIKVTINK